MKRTKGKALGLALAALVLALGCIVPLQAQAAGWTGSGTATAHITSRMKAVCGSWQPMSTAATATAESILN